MNETLAVASWNIAGARKIRSMELFDYGNEDTDYFASKLDEISADIICLQESHVDGSTTVARKIADTLGIEYVYEIDASPSHIDRNRRLGNAVISRFELTDRGSITYPLPPFTDIFADGTPAERHDKMMQLFEYNGITIANTQMLPLNMFGKTYAREEGAELAQDIQALLIDKLRSPLVLCADMNYNDTRSIYPGLYEKLNLVDALPDAPTRPNGATTDHILVSEGIDVTQSGILDVEADHLLCFAKLRVDK